MDPYISDSHFLHVINAFHSQSSLVDEREQGGVTLAKESLCQWKWSVSNPLVQDKLQIIFQYDSSSTYKYLIS